MRNMHKTALLEAEVEDLREANATQSRKKRAKRTRLQDSSRMTIGTGQSQIDQIDVDTQIVAESSRSGGRGRLRFVANSLINYEVKRKRGLEALDEQEVEEEQAGEEERGQAQQWVRFDTQHEVCICLKCEAAVAPGKNGSDGIVDHFRKKHQLKREELARVIAYCTAWRSRDPRDITRPDDGTAPIENLKVEKGYICTVCDKCRTTNLKILLGHPRQSDHKGIKSGREEHFQGRDLKRIYQLGLGPKSKAVRKGMRDGAEREEQETLARFVESFRSRDVKQDSRDDIRLAVLEALAEMI
ncbi:Uncharacterized protein HZ326_30153 [Fusarium oxysporum f. sp. albedinis]|nr:Uncharacterized protein HZ326_30153 [Fusarium oxysporum f. sp. albedinis]